MTSYVRLRRKLDDAEIVRRYVEEGQDSGTIAFDAQCSSTTVLDLVRAAGQTVRKPGRGVPRRRLIPDEEIVRRYKLGQNGPIIALAAGTTPGTIYRVLRDHDVTVRSSLKGWPRG